MSGCEFGDVKLKPAGVRYHIPENLLLSKSKIAIVNPCCVSNADWLALSQRFFSSEEKGISGIGGDS